MIHIANREDAHALTVVSGEALQNGMAVKLVQGDSKGDVPKVMKIAEGDIADPEVRVGIVEFVADDDLAADFNGLSSDQSLTANTDDDNTLDIPADENCNFWYGSDLRVRYHSAAVDAAMDLDTVREPEIVTFDTSTALLAEYDETGTDTNRDEPVGFIYTNDGPEILVVLDL